MEISIIVPFYNSADKCSRLLASLSKLCSKSIELIFVDDGSQDRTLELLHTFKCSNRTINLKIYSQSNKGPGGARNTGVRLASGKYMWFVDSDDDICLEALQTILPILSKNNYEFIDLNYLSGGRVTDSMQGYVSNSDGSINTDCLFEYFGRICTKIFLREFWLDNNIVYPEYCIYEDNYLLFVIPFCVKSFLKLDMLAYIHHEDFLSVTRVKSDNRQGFYRYLDRLYTAEKALICALESQPEYKELITKKFTQLYLYSSVRKLLKFTTKERLSFAFSIIQHYKMLSMLYDLEDNMYSFQGGFRRKLLFYVLWRIASPKDQSERFLQIRKLVWQC